MTSMLAKRLIKHESVSHAAEMADEDLLDQFLTGEPLEGQEAFRVMVERHGPMVLGICRYVLNQDQDAEDAFQATFLILRGRRRRSGIAGSCPVGFTRSPTASPSSRGASTVRRRNLEREGMAMLPPGIEPDDQSEHAAWNELRPVLHEEVNRLPDKYRVPVILSYLEGKTNEEVAEQLHWPVGTVKGRLSRARDLLRSRLTQRGLALSAAFLMTALSRGRVFAEVVPADLVRKTVRLAITPEPLSDTSDSPSPPDQPSSPR